MKNIIITILLLTSAANLVTACDCMPIWTFMETNCKECDVFLGEIVEDNTFKSEKFAPYYMDYRTVKVIDHVYGKSVIDTVRVYQGSESSCLSGLVKQSIGDIMLITGQVDLDIGFRNEKLIDISTMIIGACNVQSLIYRDGYVYGDITKNQKRDRERLVRSILKFVPNFLLDEEEKRSIIFQSFENKGLKQKMSLMKLKERLRNRYGK